MTAKDFLAEAAGLAVFSRDPSTKVGCVIVSRGEIVATGYNRFPRCLDEHPRIDTRELKYKYILHAEEVALLSRHVPLYSDLYCTLMPCSRCARLIIHAGIARVIAGSFGPPRMHEDFTLSRSMFLEAGVSLQVLE